MNEFKLGGTKTGRFSTNQTSDKLKLLNIPRPTKEERTLNNIKTYNELANLIGKSIYQVYGKIRRDDQVQDEPNELKLTGVCLDYNHNFKDEPYFENEMDTYFYEYRGIECDSSMIDRNIPENTYNSHYLFEHELDANHYIRSMKLGHEDQYICPRDEWYM